MKRRDDFTSGSCWFTLADGPSASTDGGGKCVLQPAAARFRSVVLFIAPAVLFLGFAYHPYIGNATDDAAIASAASDDTTRWGIAHLAIGVGYALMALAFIALRSHLRESGEDRWSALRTAVRRSGSCLFIPLTGMELALLAVAETGGDVRRRSGRVDALVYSAVGSRALSSAIGPACFSVAVARSPVPLAADDTDRRRRVRRLRAGTNRAPRLRANRAGPRFRAPPQGLTALQTDASLNS